MKGRGKYWGRARAKGMEVQHWTGSRGWNSGAGVFRSRARWHLAQAFRWNAPLVELGRGYCDCSGNQRRRGSALGGAHHLGFLGWRGQAAPSADSLASSGQPCGGQVQAGVHPAAVRSVARPQGGAARVTLRAPFPGSVGVEAGDAQRPQDRTGVGRSATQTLKTHIQTQFWDRHFGPRECHNIRISIVPSFVAWLHSLEEQSKQASQRGRI